MINNVFICPACGGSMGCWPPERCSRCGYVVLRGDGIYHFTGDQNINAHDTGCKYIGYDTIALNNDASRNRAAGSKEGRLIAQFLGPDRVLLEVGAGTGYHSIAVAGGGCRVIAGDISANMLKVMVSKMGSIPAHSLLPCRLNAYELPIGDGSVDAVLVDHMFHLIEEPARVLNEIRRVVKPGGCFLNILYSGEIVSDSNAKDMYFKISRKIEGRYLQLAKDMGLNLIERFGCYTQKIQKEKLKEYFGRYMLINDCWFEKEHTATIKDFLDEYRKMGLVNQVQADPLINRQIVEKIIQELISEYGRECLGISIKTVEKTSVQVFTVKT